MKNGWPKGKIDDKFQVREESLSLVIAIARSYVYWPGLDKDIEHMVKACQLCASAAKSSVHQPPEKWAEVTGPWKRVHVDSAGPIDDMYFLVIVDAFTKWPEIIATTRISAAATITLLRGVCARLGMPNIIVSDNGTQFTSSEFADFCAENGITHLRTASYHPQSNGQAERFVDTFKRALRKIRVSTRSLQEALDVFLLTYRSTPNRVLPEKHSPAEMMFNRRIRTSLELLRPPVKPIPVAEDVHVKKKSFNINDPVLVKKYHRNSWSWISGTIIDRIGRVMYRVNVEGGREIRAHINQMRPRYCF